METEDPAPWLPASCPVQVPLHADLDFPLTCCPVRLEGGRNRGCLRDKLVVPGVPSSDPLGPSRTQGCPCAFPGIFGAQGIRGHRPQMQSLKGSVKGGLAKGDLEEVIHKSLWLPEAKITWGSEEVLLDEQKPTAGRRVLAFPAPPQRAQAESQGGGGPGQWDAPWRLSPAGMGACLGSGLWLWVTPSLLGPHCSHPPREPPATHQEATNHSGQVPQLPAGDYLILGSAPLWILPARVHHPSPVQGSN